MKSTVISDITIFDVCFNSHIKTDGSLNRYIQLLYIFLIYLYIKELHITCDSILLLAIALSPEYSQTLFFRSDLPILFRYCRWVCVCTAIGLDSNVSEQHISHSLHYFRIKTHLFFLIIDLYILLFELYLEISVYKCTAYKRHSTGHSGPGALMAIEFSGNGFHDSGVHSRTTNYII